MNWQFSTVINWRVKGVVQKALSKAPLGNRINDLLQRALGGRARIDAHVNAKVVDDWMVFAAHFRELGRPIAGAELLEIGSGWLPILPMCFSLSGAARCFTYDVVRHIDSSMTETMLRCLGRHLSAISAASGRSESEVQRDYQRLVAANSLEDLLQRARIEYRAPADAAASGLPAQSVDVVFSNSVLEHVRKEDLDRLMVETKRILKYGGVAIHSVNCGDHYAYFDNSISPINYLKFSERRWRFWNNDLLYQNRLRPSDFLASAGQAGLVVTMSKMRPRFDLLDRLPESAVAAEFHRYTREDLCVTSVDFVAENKGLMGAQ